MADIAIDATPTGGPPARFPIMTFGMGSDGHTLECRECPYRAMFRVRTAKGLRRWEHAADRHLNKHRAERGLPMLPMTDELGRYPGRAMHGVHGHTGNDTPIETPTGEPAQ